MGVVEQEGIEAAAVVADGELDLVGQAGESDVDGAGLGVLEDVAEGFLTMR